MGSSTRVKIPHPKNGDKSKLAATRAGKYLYWWLGLAVVLMIFSGRAGRDIMNFPSKLVTFYYILLFIPVFWFVCRDSIREEMSVYNEMPNWFWKGAKLVLVAMIPIFASTVFVMATINLGFNYYDKWYAQRNSIEQLKCNIIEIDLNKKSNRYVYFEHNGKKDTYDCYTPLMDSIVKNGSEKDYQLILSARKGLLDTYVVEDWDIEHK